MVLVSICSSRNGTGVVVDGTTGIVVDGTIGVVIDGTAGVLLDGTVEDVTGCDSELLITLAVRWPLVNMRHQWIYP